MSRAAPAGGRPPGRAPRTSARPKAPARSPAARSRIWLLGVLILTFIAYAPSLDNEFTNWDDNYYVTENPLLVHPSVHDILTTPVEGNYHPLTMGSLALNYQISQLRPASYHWVTLLLHLANTALVFFFVRALAGGMWAPLVTALLFGIHPMHVESVAWISERKDVLYALFYMVGLLTYLRYLDGKRRAWLLATLGAFLLSLASKPAAVVFPLTLFAIDWYRRRPLNAASIVEKGPFLAISLVAGLLALHGQKIGGALAEAALWTPFQRLLLASRGIVMYVQKFFLPVGLSAIYPTPNPAIQGLGPEYYAALLVLLVGLPTGVFLLRRNRPALFGLSFFFINLILVLQLVPFGVALIADRYTYLPYIGLLFPLAMVLDSRSQSAGGSGLVKTFATGWLLLMIPFSLYQTWKRCDVWQSSETLWNNAIQTYPQGSYLAYLQRGYYYHHTAGQGAAALADYNEALKLNPDAVLVWDNLGGLLAEMGRDQEAMQALDRAIQLKPDLAEALNNRGGIKGRRGDLRGAVTDFTQAIQAAPSYRYAYESRAVAYYMLHEYALAIADTRRAIELDPSNPESPVLHDAIGTYLMALGRSKEAIAEYGEAIRTAPPGDPRLPGFYFNRSLAWRSLGNRSQALRDALEAQRLGAPIDPEYLQGLRG
jgi:tetratricopeptide (TPR) repeat protein